MLVILALSLTACGSPDPGGKEATYNTRCIDGVKYIYFKGYTGHQGYGYLSVKFNKDSKVETCNEYIQSAVSNESH